MIVMAYRRCPSSAALHSRPRHIHSKNIKLSRKPNRLEKAYIMSNTRNKAFTKQESNIRLKGILTCEKHEIQPAITIRSLPKKECGNTMRMIKSPQSKQARQIRNKLKRNRKHKKIKVLDSTNSFTKQEQDQVLKQKMTFKKILYSPYFILTFIFMLIKNDLFHFQEWFNDKLATNCLR